MRRANQPGATALAEQQGRSGVVVLVRQFEGAAFVRARDGARLLGIGRRTFAALVAAGRLPPGVRLGGARLWRVDTLIEAVDNLT